MMRKILLAALLTGCMAYPSPALVLQREAAEYKAKLRVVRGKVLDQEDLRKIAPCDDAIRSTDDLAHAGYPYVTAEARKAAQKMRNSCAGVDGWGRSPSDGGA